MQDKTDNSFRTSLVLNMTVTRKLRELVDTTGAANPNALISAILGTIDAEMAQLLYRRAVAEGIIKPKVKADPAKVALMERLNGLPVEELQRMVDARVK